jgi:membrane-associated phospholipid phosphatase
MKRSSYTSLDQQWIGMPLFVLLLLMCIVDATRSNHALFFWINHLSQYTGDEIWAQLTILGDEVVLMALLLPWVRKRSDIVWAILLAGLFTLIGVQGLKTLLRLKRPLAVLDTATFHLIGPERRLRAFPSGHTASMFRFIGVWVLAGVTSTQHRIALVSLAALVGISRIVVGVHWPLDVLAGALLGWGAAYCGYWTARKWPWGTGSTGRCVLGVTLFIVTIILLSTYRTGYAHSLGIQRFIALYGVLWGSYELFHLFRDRRIVDNFSAYMIQASIFFRHHAANVKHSLRYVIQPFQDDSPQEDH